MISNLLACHPMPWTVESASVHGFRVKETFWVVRDARGVTFESMRSREAAEAFVAIPAMYELLKRICATHVTDTWAALNEAKVLLSDLEKAGT